MTQANLDDQHATQSADGTWLILKTPDYDTTANVRTSYLRLGAPDSKQENALLDSQKGAPNKDELRDKSTPPNTFPGWFEYTDGDRTQVTRGNYKQIVRGQGRIVINGGDDDPTYELTVEKDYARQVVNTPYHQFNSGAALSFYGGFQWTNVVGAAFSSQLGTIASLNLGFKLDATVGYQTSIVAADTYTYTKGETLSDASTIDSRAKDKIQFSIKTDKKSALPELLNKELGVSAVLAAAVAVGTTVAGTQAKSDTISGGVTAGAAGAMILAMAVARYRSKERELKDGNPILSLDKGENHAVLRSDDWLLMLSPNFGILGKNKKYGIGADEETEVAKLKDTDAGTAVIINENEKLVIQAAHPKFNMATITLDKTGITIKADTVAFEGATAGGDAAVTIKGTLKVEGKVTVTKDGFDVTGDSKVTGKLTHS